MKITEHNCEEYFLLYVDDELNNVERSAVEAFVQEHPQCKAALDALLKTKLTANEEVFFDKNSLFKNEEREIGIHNYEEYFFLYTDNELSQEEREVTERFVLQHPQLQAEFMWLQKAKLPVENIVFEGKEKLYKRERRIIPMYVTRLAIAASLTGAIVMSWFLFSSRQTQATVAVVKPAVQQQKPVVTLTQNHASQVVSATPSQLVVVKKNGQKQTFKTVSSNEKTNRLQQSNDDNNEIAVDNKMADETTTPTNAAVTPEATQTAMQKAPVAVANKTAETLKPLEEIADEDTHPQTAVLVSADDNITKPAVYKKLNTDDDSHTLYVASLQLNKAKVNGILKTASRLFGGKAKQNMD